MEFIVKTFICPNCGGDLTYDIHSGMLTCTYCSRQYSLFGYRDFDDISKHKNDGMVSYHCPTCGAEVLTADTTVADECAYCGNPIVSLGKMTGKYEPDWILPFEITKSRAKELYSSFLKRDLLAPASFRKTAELKEIKGIYVPVWLFTFTGKGTADFYGIYNTEKVINHNKFGPITVKGDAPVHIHEEGSALYENIVENGSSKMDDTFMECVGPFDYNRRASFNSAYLAGFYAQKWDKDAQTMEEHAKEVVSKAIKQEAVIQALGEERVFKKDIFRQLKVRTENDFPEPNKFSYSIEDATVQYVLAPVWLLSVKYEDKNYLFGINGQTEELVGLLPTDKLKIAGLTILLVIALILAIWMYILERNIIFIFGGLFVLGMYLSMLRIHNEHAPKKKNIDIPRAKMYHTLSHTE